MKNKVCVILFCLILTLLGLTSLMPNEDSDDIVFPEMDMNGILVGDIGVKSPITFYKRLFPFVREFEDFFKKNVFRKDDFIKSYNGFFDFFGKSTIPNKVLKGKEDWYFLGNDHNDVVDVSMGYNRFDDKELDLLTKNLYSKAMFLKQNKIDYYFAVAPNKLTTYKEHFILPQYNTLTKLEQLKLRIKDQIKLVDLSTPYHRKKDSIFLFRKTDTHWSDYGALLSSNYLLKRVSSNLNEGRLKGIEFDSCITHCEMVYDEDLARMLNVKIPENRLRINVCKPLTTRVKSSVKKSFAKEGSYTKDEDYEHRYKSDVNNLKVLVFTDSFGTQLREYFKESFGETVFIWSHHKHDKELILKEQPDIVIDLIVERNIDIFLTRNLDYN